MFVIAFFLLAIPIVAACMAAIDFCFFLVNGRRVFTRRRYRNFMNGVTVLVMPALFLLLEAGSQSTCCDPDATFAPGHRLSIYLLIAACGAAYFISTRRKTLLPPLTEVLLNVLLVIGVVLNIVIAIQLDEEGIWLLGNLPIMLLFLLRLMENHRLFVDWAEQRPGGAQGWAWRLLRLKVFWQLPILLLLAFPLVALLAAFLLLFGQKPDSLVRAFTQTYSHGLSELDPQCAGVVCGGHYLCTVAACGHPGMVRPLRLGKRHGRTILCNRQLLVSNAFEELIQQRFPRAHRFIRRNYDRIGDAVEKHYHLFNNKWLSDLIYLLMKPLEWLFVIILYLSDKNPEARIERQYAPTHHTTNNQPPTAPHKNE